MFFYFARGRGRVLVAFIVVGLVIAGVLFRQAKSASDAGPTPATVTTIAAGQTTYSYSMPASSTPTNCTVSLQGHDVEITYNSPSFDVSSACRT